MKSGAGYDWLPMGSRSCQRLFLLPAVFTAKHNAFFAAKSEV